MAAGDGWRSVSVYHTTLVVFTTYFFTRVGGQDCMGSPAAVKRVYDSCVQPVMTSLRWRWDTRRLDDILTTTEFWQGYCRGMNGLQDCLSGQINHDLCGQGERLRFVQIARFDITYRLARRGFYPIPETVCDGQHIKHEIQELYRMTTGGFFSQCMSGVEVVKCLNDWYSEASQHYLRDSRGKIVRNLSKREYNRLRKKTLSAHQCVRRETQTCDSGSQNLAMFIFTQTIPIVVKGTFVPNGDNSKPFQNGDNLYTNSTYLQPEGLPLPWEFWMLVQFVHVLLFA